MIIGKTISFAGKPRINPISITPSKPKSFANGSKNSVQWVKRERLPTLTFAKIQITAPAGAATAAALPKTKRVLSVTERSITLNI